MMYYSGIGSRETPITLKPLIKRIVEILNNKDYCLRSGGANGADMFFEEYAKNKEIYLPWKGFNGNDSELYFCLDEAIEMAKRFHPIYDKLSPAAKKLMARNSHQIFGKDMKTPVEFVVCWTKDGKATGGTGQALKIAKSVNIPIYNLYNEKEIQLLLNKINTVSIF